MTPAGWIYVKLSYPLIFRKRRLSTLRGVSSSCLAQGDDFRPNVADQSTDGTMLEKALKWDSAGNTHEMLGGDERRSTEAGEHHTLGTDCLVTRGVSRYLNGKLTILVLGDGELQIEFNDV